jgi:hypothetical protein
MKSTTYTIYLMFYITIYNLYFRLVLPENVNTLCCNLLFVQFTVCWSALISVLLSHVHHVGVNNTGNTTMKPQKFLHIRIPYDFQQQLAEYAADRFIPVSGVVLNAVAKEIGYKSKKATPRSSVAPQAVDVDAEFGDLSPDDYGTTEDDDIDFAELQRRAAAAPLRPAG